MANCTIRGARIAGLVSAVPSKSPHFPTDLSKDEMAGLFRKMVGEMIRFFRVKD